MRLIAIANTNTTASAIQGMRAGVTSAARKVARSTCPLGKENGVSTFALGMSPRSRSRGDGGSGWVSTSFSASSTATATNSSSGTAPPIPPRRQAIAASAIATSAVTSKWPKTVRIDPTRSRTGFAARHDRGQRQQERIAGGFVAPHAKPDEREDHRAGTGHARHDGEGLRQSDQGGIAQRQIACRSGQLAMRPEALDNDEQRTDQRE